jgi:hypothetical protein
MALIGRYTQQPRETMDYDIDCAWLPTGDVVTAVELSVSPAGLSTSYAISGRTVKVWCYGGDDGVTYKITVLVTSAGSRVREAEFKVKVIDE